MTERRDVDEVTRNKAAARTAIRAARRERLTRGGPGDREAEAATLAEHGMAWLADHERALGRPVTCVTAYQEMAAEPPMSAFVQALLDRDIEVLVPITLPQGVLRWRAAASGRRDNPMAPQQDSPGGTTGESDASSGSEALAQVDVAFIPALALGPQGARLGQGGGYYDRAIPALRSTGRDVPVVAVVYPGEVGQDVPALSHDILVDAALTPDGVEQMTGDRGFRS